MVVEITGFRLCCSLYLQLMTVVWHTDNMVFRTRFSHFTKRLPGAMIEPISNQTVLNLRFQGTPYDTF